MNMQDKRAMKSNEEPLIAPCINVTVCAVSYLSVKTVRRADSPPRFLYPRHRDAGLL